MLGLDRGSREKDGPRKPFARQNRRKTGQAPGSYPLKAKPSGSWQGRLMLGVDEYDSTWPLSASAWKRPVETEAWPSAILSRLLSEAQNGNMWCRERGQTDGSMCHEPCTTTWL